MKSFASAFRGDLDTTPTPCTIGSYSDGSTATAVTSGTSAVARPTNPASAFPVCTNWSACRTDPARTSFGWSDSQSPARVSASRAAAP
jgi:hypothetical protein